MNNSFSLSGIHVPVITPLSENGTVDFLSLEALVAQLINNRVHGIVALGTTGEPATLSSAEKDQVLNILSKLCDVSQTPLTIGVGGNNTKTTIESIKQLEQFRHDALMVVVPYYTRPGMAGAMAHFEAVANSSPKPIVIYNIPYRTGTCLNADAIIELSKHENIIGIKQAVGGIDIDTMNVYSSVDENFSVMCGEDAYILPSLVLGARGAISALGNICSDMLVKLYNSYIDNDLVMSRKIHEALLPVVEAGFSEPNPSVFKGILAENKVITSPELRLPMVKASQDAVNRASDALALAEKLMINIIN